MIPKGVTFVPADGSAPIPLTGAGVGGDATAGPSSSSSEFTSVITPNPKDYLNMTKENRLKMVESLSSAGTGWGADADKKVADKLLKRDELDLEALATTSALNEPTAGVLPLNEGEEQEHAAEAEALSAEAEAELELATVTPDRGGFFLKVGPYTAFQHIPPLKSISTEGREFARDLLAERDDLSRGWNAHAAGEHVNQMEHLGSTRMNADVVAAQKKRREALRRRRGDEDSATGKIGFEDAALESVKMELRLAASNGKLDFVFEFWNKLWNHPRSRLNPVWDCNRFDWMG